MLLAISSCESLCIEQLTPTLLPPSYDWEEFLAWNPDQGFDLARALAVAVVICEVDLRRRGRADLGTLAIPPEDIQIENMTPIQTDNMVCQLPYGGWKKIGTWLVMDPAKAIAMDSATAVEKAAATEAEIETTTDREMGTTAHESANTRAVAATRSPVSCGVTNQRTLPALPVGIII